MSDSALPAAIGAAVLGSLFNSLTKVCMRFSRCALLTGVLVGVGLILGCGDGPQGMRNMQPDTGSKERKDLPSKKENKPGMPIDPPAPMAPPR